MGLFGCRACKAKDSEIAHLLVELTQVHAHLEKTVARLTELTAPGANARAVPPERKVRVELQDIVEKKEREKAIRERGPVEDNFPGYERPEPRDRYEVS